MLYSLVGNTNINCSKIVLGTDYFGKLISQDDSFQLMDYYCERGGNMLDTAHVYSDYIPGERHMSEKVIGRWLKKRGKKDIYISTKGAFPYLDDYHKSRLSYNDIKNDLESSLDLLGIDCVDMYWLHRDNSQILAGEVASWMDEFVKKGMIANWGVSNWTCRRIDEANEYALEHGLSPVSAGQIRWSLASVTPGTDKDDTLVEMNRQEYAGYVKNKIPVFAFSSQAKGFFTKIRENSDGTLIMPEGKAGLRYSNEENIATYYKLKKIQNELPEATISQLALLPIIKGKICGFAIVGCKNISHLEDTMKSTQIADAFCEEYINKELNPYEIDTCNY